MQGSIYSCAKCGGWFGFDKQADYITGVINGEWLTFKVHRDCAFALHKEFDGSALDAILHLMSKHYASAQAT